MMDGIAKFVGYAFLILLGIGIFVNLTEDGSVLEPKSILFMDEDSYVASKDATIFQFSVSKPTRVRMVLTIKNQAPLDVITEAGKVTEAQYMAAIGTKAIVDVISIFSEDAGKDMPNFFGNSMSQQGVYQNFSTPWVKVDTGNYSIIVDNTNAFTPSRGDAPINLKLYERPLTEG
ncbi:MAG: hypothetical protein AB2687_03490 [Candidatus Thiodiazotropha taylori]